MLHFSCDMCGRPLSDERFVAHIEIRPAFDPDEIKEADLDVDHLQQVAEIIEDNETNGDDTAGSEPKQFRFDLCHECLQRYAQDPLGRESVRRLNFSEN